MIPASDDAPAVSSTGLFGMLCSGTPPEYIEIILWNGSHWFLGECRPFDAAMIFHESGSGWKCEIEPSHKWLILPNVQIRGDAGSRDPQPE